MKMLLNRIALMSKNLITLLKLITLLPAEQRLVGPESQLLGQTTGAPTVIEAR